MGTPAARKTDPCICPSHKVSSPAPAGRPTTVRINGQVAAHQGDQRLCPGGGSDSFKGGAATVKICGCHAVRMVVDPTMHGGRFLVGSGNVLIGGPSIVGEFAKWKSICHQMEETRESGHHNAHTEPGTPAPHFPHTDRQSYQNCGLEAVRMLVWGLTDHRPTEREMIDRAAGTKDSGGRPVTEGPKPMPPPPVKSDIPPPKYHYDDTGRTSPDGRERMLEEYGVPGFDGASASRRATPQHRNDIQPTVENLEKQLAEGKPAIVSTKEGGNHVVLAIAAEYDVNGKLVAIYINDTGVPNGCATRVPVEQMRGRIRGEPITIL